MKTPILKAVAMPPRLFWAPTALTLVNIAVQTALILVALGIASGKLNPLVFIISFSVVQIGLIIWGSQEPHLGTILPCQKRTKKMWGTNDKIKPGILNPKPADGGFGIEIKGRQIRVITLNGDLAFAADWRKWLMAMARYPVNIQSWISNQGKMRLIISADAKEPYRLREAVQDTMSLLREFLPVESGVPETMRIWEEILAQDVRFLKSNGMFVTQNSRKYMVFLSVGQFGDSTDTNMITELLALNAEINIMHHIKVLPSAKANALLMQERKAAFLSSFSQNIYNQYTQALEAIDTLSEFPQVATRYGLVLEIGAPSMMDMEKTLIQVAAIMKRYGVKIVREKNLAKACFTTQFPDAVGVPRRFLMLSDNVVTMLNIPQQGGPYSGEQF